MSEISKKVAYIKGMAEGMELTADTAKEAHAIDPRRKAALDTALAQVEKNFGKGSAMRLGDKPPQDVEVIPTGSLALDMALGIGGLPKGRIVEIYGPESSGKTTLALHIVAEAQKRGGEAAFIDAEHALDPSYARALGVDIDSMLISQPDTGEQGLEICEALVRSGAIDVVVVDSVAALVPRAEIEGEMGDSYVGLQARLMSQALRKLTGAIGKTNCIVIFINQLREKVGIMYGEAARIDGLVDRVFKQLGYEATVVATGGLAHRIAPLSNSITEINLELTLQGLRMIYNELSR